MNADDLDFHQLYKGSAWGTYGGFGIKIEVAATTLSREQLMASDRLRRVSYECEDKLKNALMAEMFAVMPQAHERTKEERTGLLGAFASTTPIFVEEIPNGYCREGCCYHLPWFIVTTPVGRIKIGWRKSVINIDWTETKGTLTSKELFESEEVTKDTRSIHAYGYERAKAYVDAILTGVPAKKREKIKNEPPVPA
jgi:hypothetical protein